MHFVVIHKLFWIFIETKTLIQSFRFNNPKQFSNWIILVSFCSSHLAIKIAPMFILWNLKNWCKNRFFRKKFKKVCVLQRRACNKFKRNYLKNYNDLEVVVKTKNAPFFMNFPNINKNGQLFPHSSLNSKLTVSVNKTYIYYKKSFDRVER